MSTSSTADWKSPEARAEAASSNLSRYKTTVATTPLLVVDVLGTIETTDGEPIVHVVSWVRQRIDEGDDVIIWSGLGQTTAQRCIDDHGFDGAQAWSKTQIASLIEVARGRTTTFIDDDDRFLPPIGSLLHPNQLR